MSGLPLLRPAWDAPASVQAAMSLRAGGLSQGPWASLNLGGAVGDDAQAVQGNRARWAAALGAQPVWLRQVHGCTVLRLDAASAAADLPNADAAWTTARGLACTVLVADCLPVLMASRCGTAVAAAHAGWRGLAGGVLEATLHALWHGAGVAPDQVCVWLGPCIGSQAFEVGADVLQVFGVAQSVLLGAGIGLAAQGSGDGGPAASSSGVRAGLPPPFVPHPRPDGSLRWRADLQGLARQRLRAAGVTAVQCLPRCTLGEPSDFFSYRRDGVTGRHAAAVWLV